MVDRELGLKVVTKFDNKGLVATKKELRESKREAALTQGRFQKLSDTIERINRLEGRGLLTREQAARRRVQLRGQAAQQSLEEVGAGRLSILLGARGPLVAIGATVAASVQELTNVLKRRSGDLATAESLGVNPRNLSILRRRISALPIAGDAIDPALRNIGERAFRRGTTVFEEAERTRRLIEAAGTDRGRALRAQRLLGNRVFGRRDVLEQLGRGDDPFAPGPLEIDPRDRRGFEGLRRGRPFGRGLREEIIPRAILEQLIPEGVKRLLRIQQLLEFMNNRGQKLDEGRPGVINDL